MAADRIWELYRGSEFLTPGARETLDLISQHAPPAAGARVLDVAYGTGSGACLIAGRHGCSVLGVDVHPFAAATTRAAASRGLAERAAFVIGDGGQLPVRDGAFDLAMCVGAPSIVGTERCMAAMRRALRAGGSIGVSDLVFARTPVPAEVVLEGLEPLTQADYAAIIERAGFEMVHSEVLPWEAWERYYAPLRVRLEEMRAKYPGEPDGSIAQELALVDSGLAREHWRYTVFIARAV